MLIEANRKDLKRAATLLDEQHTLLRLQTNRATESIDSLANTNAWNDKAAVGFYLKWKFVKTSAPYNSVNKQLLNLYDLVSFAEKQYANAQATAYNHAGWLPK